MRSVLFVLCVLFVPVCTAVAIDRCIIDEHQVDIGEFIYCNPAVVEANQAKYRATSKGVGRALISEFPKSGRILSSPGARQRKAEKLACERAKENAPTCSEIDVDQYIDPNDFDSLFQHDCSQEMIPNYWREQGWECFPAGMACGHSIEKEKENCTCRTVSGGRSAGVECVHRNYCATAIKQNCFATNVSITTRYWEGVGQ